MATLVSCPHCARHVRASEKKCPFCDASVDLSANARALGPMPADRLLARTAITFAAAAVTTLAGCGKEPAEKGTTPVDTGNMTAPAYGPPPVMFQDAAVEPAPTATTSTNDNHRAPVPAYGVPPINRNPTPKK